MSASTEIPAWLLRPLPAFAEVNSKLHAEITKLAERRLPDSLLRIDKALGRVRSQREYDAAANLAGALVWQMADRILETGSDSQRAYLLAFAEQHMVEEAKARICRRLAKDSSAAVRQKARKLIERGTLHEVALPAKPDGPWDPTGWLHGINDEPLRKHAQGKQVWDKLELPAVSTLKQLRKLLDIRSAKQLGYFLLASDAEGGPYTRFTIPKRSGGEREICAPKKQLRWVQRAILDRILAKVPAHTSAHGFVPSRSTVTNALPHQGAKLVLKFDLTDFFPTIHYFRVLGLFASLGYYAADARFSGDDDSRRVAPTLARLCCHTPDPKAWGDARLPQGAPTSPAISNLVCRRLDARLDGLAKRSAGVYTRYADDLTFSFKEELPAVGRFRWWVDQVCHQEGFFVNQAKFRVIRASQRQVVTGIVVNDVLRIPREKRRAFRAILHNCRQHGVESQARGNKAFPAWLRGFASYIHMVHPAEGAELLEQVEELVGPEPDDGQETP